MKRVLDCTRCKYFISCEPGKLAFATYYGCKEYEEKEGNGKMEKATEFYEVKVSDSSESPKILELRNFVVFGYDKNHQLQFANFLDPDTLNDDEQIEIASVCRTIHESLPLFATRDLVVVNKDANMTKNFNASIDQFLEACLKERQEARETMGLETCEECKMGEICNFTMGAVKSPYKDTVKGMLSEDYKERFKAEYEQTKIRYEKLKAFCNRIEAAMMTSHEGKKVDMPAHDCPYELLRTQQGHMGQYLHDLEIRAVIEGIEL